MSNQLFAKIGVFVLLGLNVGAYYIFWPSKDSGPRSEAKAPKEEKGTAKLFPAQATVAKPREIAPAALASATTLTPTTMEASPDEAVSKLLEHIKKETEADSKPPAVIIPSTAPKPFDEKNFALPEPKENLPKKIDFPDDTKPKTLPLLKGEPLLPEGNNPNFGIAPANGPAGAWLLHTETVGGQTLLIAKLRQPTGQAIEFRIWCDRVDTKGPGGDVQAIGKVTFAGPGLKGTCQHLTFAFYASRILFEEQVVLVQEGVGSTLRADRISWELPAEMTPSTTK